MKKTIKQAAEMIADYDDKTEGDQPIVFWLVHDGFSDPRLKELMDEQRGLPLPQ